MIKRSMLQKIEITLAFLVFSVFLIYFIPSPNHEIRIHDTFDGNFSTRHVLVNSGQFFDTNPNTVVPGIMNGLPRGVFPRFTEITSLFMYFFGSLNGFAICFILIRILAFAGIYLFGRDHLHIGENQTGLLVLFAVAFACLPFFVIHGLTVAGIPLVLWAFFNIYKNKKPLLSYLVFILFVFWSNFVLVGVHLIICLGCLAIYFSFAKKKIQFPLFIALAFITVLYILSDYMLFYMHYFNKNYHSSREAVDKVLGLNFNGVAGNTLKKFFTGDYSTAAFFGYLFIPFFAYFSIAYLKNKEDALFKTGLLFIILTAVCSVLISLLDWKSFSFFYEKIPFAKVFNFKRFTSLLPGFFFIATLTLVIAATKKELLLTHVGSACLIITSFFFLWRGNISYNRSGFDTSGLSIENEQRTTFNAFFDPVLYRQIKKEIGADTLNNIIHFGVSPSPSKYAGLNVLDDYQGDYPSEYKSKFREIIEGELNKSKGLRTYFDNWGARCYLTSATLFEGRSEIKNGFPYEKSLAINSNQIKKMNGHFILSSILIGNSDSLNLKLQKVLVSAMGYKPLLLYKIN